MIDWLTMIIDSNKLNNLTNCALDQLSDKVLRVNPQGDIVSASSTWNRLRSDSQGLTFHYTPNELTICGSPASVVSHNNVFGSDDIVKCFNDMLRFFAKHTGIFLPTGVHLWKCTRIDITYNYDMGAQHQVEQALHFLKYSKTRGDNVSRRQSTVYWNKGSAVRQGKAYNKYLHAKSMLKSAKHFYTDDELELSKKILRLELTLSNEFMRRQRELKKEWHKMTAEILQFEHKKFFDPCVGSVEVPSTQTLLSSLEKVAPSDNQARAALNTFLLISKLGIETVKGSMSRPTFYRHTKMLKNAGLSVADLNAGQILEFRKNPITLGEPVHNWNDLKVVI